MQAMMQGQGVEQPTTFTGYVRVAGQAPVLDFVAKPDKTYLVCCSLADLNTGALAYCFASCTTSKIKEHAIAHMELSIVTYSNGTKHIRVKTQQYQTYNYYWCYGEV